MLMGMDLSIALILAGDGVTNAAIYALLALAMVLVFSVTRVIFVPIGEFVSFGALTLAALEAGRVPGTAWLLGVTGVVAAASDLASLSDSLTPRRVGLVLLRTLVLPGLAIGATVLLAPLRPPQAIQIALALAVTAPIALNLYDAVYRPIAAASVLSLLIVSVALHLALVGLGLVFFGPEGSRTTALSETRLMLGDLLLSGQSLAVLGTTALILVALALFFGRTLVGKALTAIAVNRVGARLVGVAPDFSGRVAFGLAGAIGALGGILVSPITTIYYDTGFIIGLKAFVAAIVGGLVSYPVAAVAAIGVGVVEAFASFWASDLKEVIVFLLIVPVLLVRSARSTTLEDEEA